MASFTMTKLFSLLVLSSYLLTVLGGKRQTEFIEKVDDVKVFKKILKTRLNVLTLFTSSDQAAKKFLPTFERVAEIISGKGTLVYVNCKDAKKMCKNLKVDSGDKFILKHYMEGKYHKDYDRQLVERSLLNFMENPTQDAPWSEDPTAGDVQHLETIDDFQSILTKSRRPVLIMYYAPWCGHCKALKPHFAEAATELKKEAVLAGMNVDKPDLYPLRQALNITGFPTLQYYVDGAKKYDYSGGRTREGIVEWMRDPTEETPAAAEAEGAWSEEESHVVHLTMDTFDSYLAENPSVLVMFYAPWCGHCKAMKPHYTEAAQLLSDEGVSGTLAAVDATKEQAVASKFEVKGFPTVKYFKDGELAYDYGFERTTEALVEFMKDPKEPPPPPPPEPEWKDTPSAVNHLDDENFESFLKKKKHALVMFYAPWCGHCKKAKPEFTEAADTLSYEKKKAFAALDCTQYQEICTQQGVQGFPTFKYYSYGKRGYQYSQGRMKDDFVNFMVDPDSVVARDEL